MPARRREAGSSRSKAARARASRCRRAARATPARPRADVVLTREPGGSPQRKPCANSFSPAPPRASAPCGEALLFCAARIDHIDTTIAPALRARRLGRLRPLRRFDPRLSGRRRPSSTRTCSRASSTSRSATCRPDLTLILDLPAARASPAPRRRRGAGRSGGPFRERRRSAFHETLRHAFLAIARAEPERCAVIDAGAGRTKSPRRSGGRARAAGRRADAKGEGAMSKALPETPPESDAFPGAPHPRLATR